MPTYFSSAVLKFVFCCASNQVYSCSFRSVNVTFSHCHISDLGVRADDFDGFNTCRLAPFFALARGLPHAPQRGGAASALKHADGVRLAHCAHLRRPTRLSVQHTLASRRQAASCNARSSVILVQGASAPVSQRIILMPHFIIVTLCACVL
jgi:hypothetical protein